MSDLVLTYLHLSSVIPAFFIGTYLMIRRKGSSQHRLLGRIYMLLLLFTAVVTLFMQALVGPKWLGHFGFIHLFSVLTLYAVPTAYWAARRHQVQRHRYSMIGTYVGAILIAGAFAFMPGRYLHQQLIAPTSAGLTQ